MENYVYGINMPMTGPQIAVSEILASNITFTTKRMDKYIKEYKEELGAFDVVALIARSLLVWPTSLDHYYIHDTELG